MWKVLTARTLGCRGNETPSRVAIITSLAHTNLIIARVEDEPQAGEYLFTPATVGRLNAQELVNVAGYLSRVSTYKIC
jgi:hypothetical protein